MIATFLGTVAEKMRESGINIHEATEADMRQVVAYWKMKLLDKEKNSNGTLLSSYHHLDTKGILGNKAQDIRPDCTFRKAGQTSTLRLVSYF